MKLKRFFAAVGLLATLVPALTGCTIENKLTRAEDLTPKIKNVLCEKIDLNEQYSLVDFELIGTDIAKTAFNFDVRFNGVASLSNGDRAFASLNYNIPSEEFLNLKKRSDYDKVYDVLDKIVQQYNPSSYSITPVTNIVNINDAFVKNAPTPFKNYNIKDAMVYSLGQPVFNDEEKTITFNVNTIMELDRTKRQAGWGLCFGFDGSVCFGYGIPIASEHAKGTFTTVDQYIVKVDEKTYENMKANPKLIYDACAQTIKGDPVVELEADRKLTNFVTYDEADLLDVKDMHTMDSELSN